MNRHPHIRVGGQRCRRCPGKGACAELRPAIGNCSLSSQDIREKTLSKIREAVRLGDGSAYLRKKITIEADELGGPRPVEVVRIFTPEGCMPLSVLCVSNDVTTDLIRTADLVRIANAIK
jgi:hypothetical protein